MSTLELSGSGRDRGLQHGGARAPGIIAHRTALVSALERAGLEDADGYLAELLRETRFDEAIAAYAPHLHDEVRGTAEGAGVPREHVLQLQLIDEEWVYRARRKGGPTPSKCSSLAVRDEPSGTTWIGQNMDLGAYTDGFQTMVRHAPDGDRPGAMLLTIDGVLALLGVNDRGVGVCVNSLPQLPSASEGLPVAYVIRLLLEAPSAVAAAALCRSLPHATNQHYLIADAARIVSLECSSAGVTEYLPARSGTVLHTNHPLAGGAERDPAGEINSSARLRSLEGRLDGTPAKLEAFTAALSAFDDPDHPVCRLPTSDGGIIGFTTGSMVSALRAAPADIEGVFSLGPPSERGYNPYRLARHDGATA